MNTIDMSAYAEYVANPVVRNTAPRGAGYVVSMGHVWKGGHIVFSGTPAECKAQYLALRYPAKEAKVVADYDEMFGDEPDSPSDMDLVLTEEQMKYFTGPKPIGPSFGVAEGVVVKVKAKRAPRAKKVAA